MLDTNNTCTVSYDWGELKTHIAGVVSTIQSEGMNIITKLQRLLKQLKSINHTDIVQRESKLMDILLIILLNENSVHNNQRRISGIYDIKKPNNVHCKDYCENFMAMLGDGEMEQKEMLFDGESANHDINSDIDINILRMYDLTSNDKIDKTIQKNLIIMYFVFLFSLIHFILDCGLTITKISLKYKLSKCLKYLTNSLNNEKIKSHSQLYQCLQDWLNVLQFKHHIRSLMLTKKHPSKTRDVMIELLTKHFNTVNESIENLNKFRHIDFKSSNTNSCFSIVFQIIKYHCGKSNKILKRDLNFTKLFLNQTLYAA